MIDAPASTIAYIFVDAQKVLTASWTIAIGTYLLRQIIVAIEAVYLTLVDLSNFIGQRNKTSLAVEVLLVKAQALESSDSAGNDFFANVTWL